MALSKIEKLKEEAKKLAIPFAEDISEVDLAELISNKKEAEAEEKRIKDEEKKKADIEAKKNKIILKNVLGEDMDENNYFHKGKVRSKDKDGKEVETIIGGAPSYFNKICGMPVDREDLVEVFNKVFKPEHNFLFYKDRNTEVYLVIVPLKHSDIGEFNDSMPHDFQKHAMSFINEGSVNLDSLRMKLEKIKKTIKIKD